MSGVLGGEVSGKEHAVHARKPLAMPYRSARWLTRASLDERVGEDVSRAALDGLPLGGDLLLTCGSALAVGLAGIGMNRRRSLPKPEDPLLEDLHFDRQELEARLGRAQEELGFFRELHGPDPLERPASPDATRLDSPGQPEAPDATRSEFSGQPESPDSNDP